MAITLDRHLAAGLLLALALLSVPGTASAARPSGHAVHIADQGGGMSLEEATAMVRSQTGGRILSAETRGRGESRVHRIKVLTEDNRVRIFRVDPGTGERR